MTRVCSDEVLYIGWKSYGMLLQPVPVGAYCTWPNELAALAVMEPLWWVVRSLTVATRPWRLSWRLTMSLSPEFMNRALVGSGVPDLTKSNWTGLAGPCGAPFRVRYAKFTYSRPPRIAFAHVGLRTVPLTGSSARLSIVIATHQRVASQLKPVNCWTYPG